MLETAGKRCCLQCRWSASFPVQNRRGLLIIFSGMFECNAHTNRTEESNMDILNIVLNVLHLIVDVILMTWAISKDVFRGDSNAKHYSDNNK